MRDIVDTEGGDEFLYDRRNERSTFATNACIPLNFSVEEGAH